MRAKEQLVGCKRKLSQVRNKLGTNGYGLFHVRDSYDRRSVRLNNGLANVFDRFYSPPLGGAYVGQKASVTGSAIPWKFTSPA
jgi:iron complex outermembrane receptor protein